MNTPDSWPRPEIVTFNCNCLSRQHDADKKCKYLGCLVSLSDPQEEETHFTLLSDYNLQSEWIAVCSEQKQLSAAKQFAKYVNGQADTGKAVDVIIEGPFLCRHGYYEISFAKESGRRSDLVLRRKYVPEHTLQEVAKSELKKRKAEQLMTPPEIAVFLDFKKRKKEIHDELDKVNESIAKGQENVPLEGRVQTEWMQRKWQLEIEKKHNEDGFIALLESLAREDYVNEKAEGWSR